VINISENKSLTRRDFVKGLALGAVAGVIGGAAGAVALRPPPPEAPPVEPPVEPPIEPPVEVPLSKGVLVVDGDICGQCGTCETFCTLINDGVSAPELARIQVVPTLQFDSEADPCLQCVEPKCLRACPVGAISIDGAAGTNARVVDEEICIGCYRCLEACPIDPARVRFDTEKQVAVKCTLCGGDPMCAKFCPTGALKYYTNPDGVISGYTTRTLVV
jgi:Fe-S-cluster-containing hydrogenase component 2